MKLIIPPSIRAGLLWVGAGFLISVAPMSVLAFYGTRSRGIIVAAVVWGSAWLVPYFLLFHRRIHEAYRRVVAHPAGLCCRCEYPLPESTAVSEEGSPPLLVCSECGCTLSRAEHEKAWRRWIDVRFKG